MDLLIDKANGVTAVSVKADYLDASNNRDFKDRMIELLPSVQHLLVDLQQVKFIDSAGLAALLSCLKQLSASGGDMKICGAAGAVKATFDLVKMHRIVEVCKSREEALQAFAKVP